jgi:anhydro-N-acetylmuramic acid kinase
MELADAGLARRLRKEDIVATLTHLTARSIARSIRHLASPDTPVHEIVVSGGGVRNLTLMRLLSQELIPSRIIPSDELGIPAHAKEAICFAVLANETLFETPTNAPSLTGASRRAICGAIRLP